MATIYRADTGRLTVAEAKQLVIDALPDDSPGYVSFRGEMNSAGEVDWDFDNPTHETFRETSKSRLDNNFLDLCKGLGFEPHLSIDPTATGYRLRKDNDSLYMITHAQFVKLADSYGLSVEIGEEVPPALAVTDAAPVVGVPAGRKKTPETRKFEARVHELMGKFWSERPSGTTPTKGDLHLLVYKEMARGDIRGRLKAANVGMIRDAAKSWVMPTVLPAYVQPAQTGEKRHPFKGDK